MAENAGKRLQPTLDHIEWQIDQLQALTDRRQGRRHAEQARTEPKLISGEEAAAMLGITMDELDRLVESGELKPALTITTPPSTRTH